ncbi:MAG: ABC transporter permease [Niabella sp.]
MTEDKIWLLITRKLAGEASEKELKEFEELRKEYPELSYQYESISIFWNTKTVMNEEADTKTFQKILNTIKAHQQYKPFKKNVMIRNYFKTAWRDLTRNRQFSILNLVGLSAGLACALLIFLWVKDEKSIDKFHEKHRRLYRVMQNNQEPGGIQTSEGAPGPLAAAFKAEMPEVEDATIVKPGKGGILSFENKSSKAIEQYVTPDFFTVFSYPLIKGKPQDVLKNKYNIIVSDELAKKLFGNTENIIGRTVEWDAGEGNEVYSVSGVFKLPANSSVRFDLLLTYDVLFEKYSSRLQNWGSSFVNTYVVLKKGTDIDRFNEKIRDFVKSKFSVANSDPAAVQFIPTIFLQKYSDQYLYNRFENGIQSGGRIAYVRLFSIIASVVLLIACINFMNLSTAKAVHREKEVGIKKIMGAKRTTLVLQYLRESVLMSFLALLIAAGIMSALLPVFNQITGKQFDVATIDSRFLIAVFCITLITGLIAGIYPAFYLSGFKPATALKGRLKSSMTELLVRKGLVVFQFSLSFIFIVAVLVIYNQMDLVQSKNLGYNKDNIIKFSNEGKLKGNGLTIFLNEVKKIPGVVAASGMRYDMKAPTGFGGLGWPGQQAGEDIKFADLEVTYDLLELFQYQLKEGRSFSGNRSGEDSKIILNESAIEAMRLKEPVGKTVSLYGKNFEIIGVTKDFHFESLHEKVKPCFFRLTPPQLSIPWNVVVKIRAGMEKETIASLAQFYNDYNQGLSFDFKFLDDDFQALYTAEKRTAVLSRYFAAMAILISCLGLFGLVTFSANKRQKEISIRKVVGATTAHIATMLSKDFLMLVLIALLIAFPIAWWVMNQWLNDFAYRIHIEAWVFFIAAVPVLLITVLTISFQAIKAAIGNPVKSLRTE